MSPTISVCLPVRNGAATLERFLVSFRPWVDELCFLDTGSTDRTLEILAEHAERPGAPIVIERGEWADDYALARNQAAELATSDYVMWAEDDVVLIGGEHLRRLLAESSIDAAMVRQISVQSPDRVGYGFEVRVSHRGVGEWVGRVHEELRIPESARVEVWSPGLVSIAHLRHPAPGRHDHRRLVELALSREPSRKMQHHAGLHLLLDEDHGRAAAAFEKAVDESWPWQREDLRTIQRSFEMLAQIRASFGDSRGAREAIDGRRRVREQIERDPIFRQCDAFDESQPIGNDHPVWRLIDEALS